jgi:hypothetical protein
VEAREGAACGKLPRWTCPNDSTIWTVSANSANRAPAFNFALNHCITKILYDAVLTTAYVIILDVKSRNRLRNAPGRRREATARTSSGKFRRDRDASWSRTPMPAVDRNDRFQPDLKARRLGHDDTIAVRRGIILSHEPMKDFQAISD